MVLNHAKLRPTRDHVIARSKAIMIYELTGHNFNRQVIVCHECNSVKGDLSLTGFAERLEEKNRKLMEEIELNQSRIENVLYLARIGLED